MLKVGILGGGQLGRMLLQAAANYPVETYLMEKDEQSPAAHLAHHFVKGDIRNFEEVYSFGKGLDALTIEIESVNDEALEKLEAEGVKIYPKPSALKIIKNKITQKQYYAEHSIPSAEFIITQSLADVRNHPEMLPAVHKLAVGGYDGKGVHIIQTKEEIEKGFDAPGVLEKLIPVDKEISQVIAVGQKGETAIYPPVDMVFDQRLNLLDYQISPAELPQSVLWKLEAISLRVVKELKSPGIFAVELFVTKQGDVYVNETAPRVHNSGHHTIEANYSSQFDMLWRVILGYPLGNTEAILPGAIVNLIGAPGCNGEAYYEGLEEVLQMDNVFVHIYGKNDTKPGRKMGHVTIISREKQDLVYKAHKIKNTLKVITKEAAAAAKEAQKEPVVEMRDRSIGK
ncbi:MAG TPA: 5-(carboxyamino)imidazole ribonucleotide synthase [Puia sp.]|nr:5-(carboxyamino)imidazole ribonucleotide synthase [Puia sp.]